MSAQEKYLPEADRLGALAALVLLAYALTHWVQAPQFTLSIRLPGFFFAFPITLSTVMTLLAAGLSAAGMDWLLRAHPSLGNRPAIEHWMLPTLSTFVIGGLLALLPANRAWWLAFAIGATLLILIFLAEYIVVEPAAPGYPTARALLTATSYALFLILATALRQGGARLVVLTPVIFVVSSLISLRIVHLDGADRWDFPWALGIGLVCAQMAAGLHYWPITPLQFGLALTGPFYALTILAMNITEEIPLRRALPGPLLILFTAWLVAAFLRG